MRIFAAVIASVSTLFATGVNATVITNWNFTTETGFFSYTGTPDPGGVTGTVNNAFLSASNSVIGPVDFSTIGNLPTVLSWGTPLNAGGPQSSLVLSNAGHSSGSVFTNGPQVNTLTLTHNNNEQALGSESLATAKLFAALFLDPEQPQPPAIAGPSDQFLSRALAFALNFTETPNTAPCADTTSLTPCNDIFVLDVVGAGFSAVDNSLSSSFDLLGENYLAKLFIIGLGQLTDAECAAASAAKGCIGFTTQEGKENTFQGALQISSVVPTTLYEPGTLGLFVFGLGWLGLARRQWAKAKFVNV